MPWGISVPSRRSRSDNHRGELPQRTPLQGAISAFNGSPLPSLQADRGRLASYATSGTFTSSVFDAGRTATWGVATWTSDLSAGTSLTLQTSSSVDGITWTPWVAVNNGLIASLSGRYLQYRIRFTTTDPTRTATLYDISFTWN